VATEPQELAYVAYTAARSAFFTATALATAAATGGASTVAERMERQGLRASEGQGVSAEGLARVLESQAELYRRDLDNIRQGLYRAPYDMHPSHRQWSPGFVADKARRLLRSSREIMQRRTKPEASTELRRTSTDAAAAEPGAGTLVAGAFAYPDTFLQNFHWQSDGWMSVRSARIYEFQTETLFQGSQDAMQRAALAPLGRYMAGRDASSMTLLEVAAGTGRFHTFIKDNYPSMRTTLSDLSPYYLGEARENVEYFADFNARVNPQRAMQPTSFVQAAAQDLPFPDASFDVVMNIYLFHEMEATQRAQAAAEMARCLKPGGLLVLNDSLQRGDRPEIDAVMHLFPANYHEPFYMEYTELDMQALFAGCGLQPVSVELAHVSKVWAFRKPTEEEVMTDVVGEAMAAMDD